MLYFHFNSAKGMIYPISVKIFCVCVIPLFYQLRINSDMFLKCVLYHSGSFIILSQVSIFVFSTKSFHAFRTSFQIGFLNLLFTYSPTLAPNLVIVRLSIYLF